MTRDSQRSSPLFNMSVQNNWSPLKSLCRQRVQSRISGRREIRLSFDGLHNRIVKRVFAGISGFKFSQVEQRVTKSDGSFQAGFRTIRIAIRRGRLVDSKD